VGATKFVADVVVPYDFTVGRIEKRDSVASKVKGAFGEALAISFRLGENALWPQRQLLGLDDSEDSAVDAENIIRRPVGSGKLFDGARRVGIQRHPRRKRQNAPARSS